MGSQSPISTQKWLDDEVHNFTRHVQCHAFNYDNDRENEFLKINKQFTHNIIIHKNEPTQGVNCILSRMLHYAQKISYGAVSFLVYTCSYKFYTYITGRLPVQYLLLGTPAEKLRVRL